MTRSIVLCLALAPFAVSCSQNRAAAPVADGHHTATPAAASSTQHGMFRPDQISWKPGPPSLPPGAKFAVLEGDPSKAGYFAMRIVFPDGYRIPPHWHPGIERLTIMSGTFRLGMGEKFDPAVAESLPAGTYTFMPPGMRHYAWAEGETTVQLATQGPWGVTYVNPADDPRAKK